MEAWITNNWYTLLQATGVVGGLLFTAISLRMDAKVRKVGNLLTLTAHHRDIWTQLYRRPELTRVLSSEVDLASHPVTPEEGVFVRILILHLSATYRALAWGLLRPPEALGQDVAAVFSLPIVRRVWESVREYQDRDFVRFVDACLQRGT